MNRRGFFAMLGGLALLPFVPKAKKPKPTWQYKMHVGTCWTSNSFTVPKELYAWTAGNLDMLGGRQCLHSRKPNART